MADRATILWGCSLAAIALFAASPGYAQSTGVPADSMVAADPEPAPEPDAQTDNNGIEDIVVTARRRSENLQNTPISISAFSGDGLQERGISNVSDVDTSVPNLVFQRSAAQSGDKSSAQIFIRGVGQTDFTLTTDPGVGLYLDGVYIARSIGSALDVLDIERIEVLRGPQGTLFGRNTIGGAISITSRAPSFDELSASGAVTFGRFDRFDFRGSINVPIADNLAMSASLMRKTSDGYIARPNIGTPTGEDDLWAARVALRWEPSPNVRFNAAADGTIIRETSCCSELVAVYPGILTQFHNAVVAPTLVATLGPRAFFDNGSLPTRNYSSNATFSRPANLNLLGLSFTGEIDLTDDLMIKSITAYRTFDSINGGDFDHTPLRVNETVNVFENNQFSQELQLQGSLFGDRLKYIAGAYYFRETGFNEDAVNFSIVRLVSGGFTDNSSIAAFGQGTFDITERLSLTAGLRWTRDRRRFTPRQFVVENQAGVPSQVRSTPGNLVPLVPGQLVVPNTQVSLSVADATPYVNLSWQATDRFMVYASYSEGFKSGGFVQRIFPDRLDIPRFAPETVQVVEAGFKFQTDNRRLRLNAAAFSTDYTNLQIQVFDGIAPVTRNAAAARIRGFEGELTLEPIDDLLIEAGVGFLDAKYTRIAAGATDITLASRLVNAPRWSTNLGISYRIPFANGWSMRPRVDWTYRSTVHNDARNTAALVQPSYNLFNAAIAIEDPSERWRIGIAGRNLTNRRYIQSGFADEAVQSVAVATFGRPVEWEISVGYRF